MVSSRDRSGHMRRRGRRRRPQTHFLLTFRPFRLRRRRRSYVLSCFFLHCHAAAVSPVTGALSSWPDFSRITHRISSCSAREFETNCNPFSVHIAKMNIFGVKLGGMRACGSANWVTLENGVGRCCCGPSPFFSPG